MKKKLFIVTPILAICIVLFTAQSTAPITKTLTRKYAESDFDLNVDQVISDFKQTLIDKKFLNKSDLNDPSAIYTKLSTLEESVDPNALGIQGFVEKKPLTEVLDSNDIFAMSPQVQADIAIFTYYQVFSAKYCDIELRLTDKRLVEFKDDPLPVNSLEAVLFENIASLAFRNITVKNARIVIKADAATPNEFVSLIRSKLAEMGLRAVKFDR